MITCSFEDGGKGLLRHVVVDAIVLKNDKVLLTKRANSLIEGGKWSLVGGFVGRDETLRRAVEREIREETGYKVKDVTLLSVNDNPDRRNEDHQNIAFVFFCVALEKEGESDWEVEDQKWFSLSDLPKDIAFDHREDLQLFIRYKKEMLKLPIFK